jgi:hypothetical protein
VDTSAIIPTRISLLVRPMSEPGATGPVIFAGPTDPEALAAAVELPDEPADELPDEQPATSATAASTLAAMPAILYPGY